MTLRPARLLLALLLFDLGAAGAAFSQSEKDGRAREIRRLVEKEIDLAGPGVAILVSRSGVPLHMAGYGLADVNAGTAITPDSLFDLASVSKQMTGVALLTLVEKGKLDLAQPVRKYVTDFSVPVKGRAITGLDLLHHVSGLADYTSDHDWKGSDEEFASLTTEGHLKWLNATKPRRAPGVKYEYNNSGYALLALIVERVSGQTFAHYLRDHLFVPAGMTHTFVLDGSEKLPSLAVKGYVTNDKGKPNRTSAPTVITGDGSVYTSVRDLALWDKALRGHRIISERSQELAWQEGRYDNDKPIRDADGDGYGFGWVIDKKLSIVSHDGSWGGSATCLILDLRKGYTVAVLSNDMNTEVSDLAEAILALFMADNSHSSELRRTGNRLARSGKGTVGTRPIEVAGTNDLDNRSDPLDRPVHLNPSNHHEKHIRTGALPDPLLSRFHAAGQGHQDPRRQPGRFRQRPRFVGAGGNRSRGGGRIVRQGSDGLL